MRTVRDGVNVNELEAGNLFELVKLATALKVAENMSGKSTTHHASPLLPTTIIINDRDFSCGSLNKLQ